MNWNRVLLLVSVGLGFAAIAPARLGVGSVIRPLHLATVFAVQPSETAMNWGFRAVLPAQRPKGTLSEEAAEMLKQQLEEARREKLAMAARVESLQTQIEQLTRVLQLNPGFAVRETTPLPVDGIQSDASGTLLKVRGGSNISIPVGAIAVAERVHLIGKVVSTDALNSRVRPIVDGGAGELTGVIFANERFQSDGTTKVLQTVGDQSRLIVKLKPAEGGLTLNGISSIERGVDPSTVLAPEEGMVVRLMSDDWPRSEQMLIIGRVSRVIDTPNGRKVVVVTPAIDPRRVSEVTVRFVDSSPAGGASGGNGPVGRVAP
ncbi:MAG: hypothetical protein IBJ18_04875 [Phycisphaerales bacterium]|nr:hypothetical protein [Phycisphaerales bacterium]